MSIEFPLVLYMVVIITIKPINDQYLRIALNIYFLSNLVGNIQPTDIAVSAAVRTNFLLCLIVSTTIVFLLMEIRQILGYLTLKHYILPFKYKFLQITKKFS